MCGMYAILTTAAQLLNGRLETNWGPHKMLLLSHAYSPVAHFSFFRTLTNCPENCPETLHCMHTAMYCQKKNRQRNSCTAPTKRLLQSLWRHTRAAGSTDVLPEYTSTEECPANSTGSSRDNMCMSGDCTASTSVSCMFRGGLEHNAQTVVPFGHLAGPRACSLSHCSLAV